MGNLYEPSRGCNRNCQEGEGGAILERDWDSTARCARFHSSLLQVSDKLVVNEWRGVWDEALNHGTKGTKLSQNLFRTLTRPLFGDKLCNLCSASITGQPMLNNSVQCTPSRWQELYPLSLRQSQNYFQTHHCLVLTVNLD